MGHLSREAGSPPPATLPAPNFPIHRHEQREAECRVRSDDGNTARRLDPRRCKLAAWMALLYGGERCLPRRYLCGAADLRGHAKMLGTGLVAQPELMLA